MKRNLLFLAIKNAAPALTLLMTILTIAFSYLAAASSASQKCASEKMLVGYRSGVADFLALPIFCASVACIIIFSRKSTKTEKFLAENAIEIAQLNLTYGEFLMCVSYATFALLSASATMISLIRYVSITNHCS